ncbi:LL-diaminopimelate aminotransferase [Simkania negevensis]|uniref:LL-diaminopimelate aminotransferase n=1 Tax=Simkania negevensis TaxID=83561 RepID=A0ABS3ARN0_9BACT|nr:LL-diaminopimelate aminotransferase [Simkania negevensis]
MVSRNPEIAHLQANYLFVEIGARKKGLLAKNPKADLINLGIGDTTEPIPAVIVEALTKKTKQLGSSTEYTGYGKAIGIQKLREGIAQKMYKNSISADDIFISDGAKPDLGRLQILFGRHSTLAVQDPSYPVYIATSVMTGKTKGYNSDSGQYDAIVYMPCKPENSFCPNLEQLPRTDLIYICSPNNPTGAVLTHQQLKKLVHIAHKNRSLIIFDAAYAGFIRDPSLPRSIYEVEGAEEVAIEVSSFSKLAGFTGVRLGWSVVPRQLHFDDGSSVQQDWIQIVSTFFNSASNIAQAGGLAAISDEGLQQSQILCDYYLDNANILRDAIESAGYTCFGGDNAPYLWTDIKGEKSWELFDRLLHKAHLVTTPGAGFGPTGEGFLRLSAFGKRDQIVEAAQRLKNALSS